MGILKDLSTSYVYSICEITGYPKNKYGHLLDSICPHDGRPVENWQSTGTELYNLTNPYGFLHFAIGSGDDFWCFDFKEINAGPRGCFVILDATINSETGSFIMGSRYEVMPCNSSEEKRNVVLKASEIAGEARSWVADNEVRHSKSDWSQDMFYFERSVASAMFSYRFKKISERQLRFSGKQVQKLMNEIYSS